MTLLDYDINLITKYCIYGDRRNNLESNLSSALAIIIILGFAIQQLIELVDHVFPIARNNKDSAETTTGPGKKKKIVDFISVILAAILVFVSYKIGEPIKTIGFIPGNSYDWIDKVVTVLVLSAGTEGMNIAIKYFDYVKEDRKKLDKTQ